MKSSQLAKLKRELIDLETKLSSNELSQKEIRSIRLKIKNRKYKIDREENLFRFVIKFDDSDNYEKYLDKLPCRGRSGGSIVWMQGSNPWLDYHDVTLDELRKTILYMRQVKETIGKVAMRLEFR